MTRILAPYVLLALGYGCIAVIAANNPGTLPPKGQPVIPAGRVLLTATGGVGDGINHGAGQ